MGLWFLSAYKSKVLSPDYWHASFYSLNIFLRSNLTVGDFI